MRDTRRRSGVDVGMGGRAASSEQAPTSKTEVSSPHARVPDVVPIGWLDRLLVAVIDLPLAEGEPAVAGAIVDAIAGILPDYAVGARIVSESASGPESTLLVRRLPEGCAEGRPVSDPARIFPGLAHEYVASVPDVFGATLHVASNELDVEPESSPAAHLLDRAALALGRAVVGIRARAARSSGVTDAGPASRPTPDQQMQRMEQADKLATFGQIAAGVVHELNNPLTSIVAYSDYLIRRTPAGADSADIDRLRRISEAANRMLRFTRDLVSYARPSSGAAQNIILHDVIDRAVAFCEHVMAASAVRIERRYSPDVRAVVGVTEQLVQVFVNLLTNASQAAPERGGQVTVTTRLDAGSPKPIVVIVEDNGSGIAAEHLPHVFAPFFTTKGDKQGTGLGLSIVRSIIEGHGGVIQVESPAGSGARFILELPPSAGRR
jgi:two-component system NtrC family sensor kinase